MATWDKQLEADLDWRRAELASLKLLATRSVTDSEERAILRALWAMLYAHYEGFHKFGWQLYLEAVASKGLRRDECIDELAIFSLKNHFKWLRSNAANSELWEFGRTGYMQEMSQLWAYEKPPQTHSNLSPDLCIECCETIGLPAHIVRTHDTSLLLLVKRRNDIAHGQAFEVKSLDEYMTFESAAMDAMYGLAIAITDALDTEAYKK